MVLSSLPLFSLLLLLVGTIAVVFGDGYSDAFEGYSDAFEAWVAEHQKTYASDDEKRARFLVFEENRAFINAHNAANGNNSYQLGLNGFADMTHSEFRAARLGLGLGFKLPSVVDEGMRDGLVWLQSGELPTSIDWREKGAVTRVKDQGSCGACWSFSATGAIEGINKIVTGSLVSLSEQELIDCDKSYNNGCNGGLMDYAYKWIIKNNGIDTEDDYPYQGREGTCNSNKVKNHVVTIDGYTDIPANSEDILLAAVANQPVSVGICGSDRYFQLYSKGVFTGPCSTSLDHAVLIVGYGSKNGVDYWIVKNSWGTSWGMSGYMYMLRNSGSSRGVCGINMLPSYPTKTSPNPPPDPSPTKCSILSYCPSGSTCCCSWRILGVCLSWSCCDLQNAVCCKDDRYCCPSDYPVCDTSKKQCLKGNGNTTSVTGTASKVPFMKFNPWNNLVDM